MIMGTEPTISMILSNTSAELNICVKFIFFIAIKATVDNCQF